MKIPVVPRRDGDRLAPGHDDPRPRSGRRLLVPRTGGAPLAVRDRALPRLLRTIGWKEASHCDFEDPTNNFCRALCGKSSPEMQARIRRETVGATLEMLSIAAATEAKVTPPVSPDPLEAMRPPESAVPPEASGPGSTVKRVRAGFMTPGHNRGPKRREAGSHPRQDSDGGDGQRRRYRRCGRLPRVERGRLRHGPDGSRQRRHGHAVRGRAAARAALVGENRKPISPATHSVRGRFCNGRPGAK